MSLLSVSDVVQATEDEVTKSREASAQVKDATVSTSKRKASFSIEVPPILGKTGDPDVTTSERALAAVQTFKDWDTGRVRDGVKDRLLKTITEGAKAISYQIKNEMSGEAALVARSMLMDSKRFWTKFAAWLLKFYSELRKRSGASEKECWTLVTHSARIIFSGFHSARNPRLLHTDAQMLWGNLQGLQFGRDLLEKKFEGHERITVVLHQHLLDHWTPLSAFVEALDRVAVLEKAVVEAKSLANKALSAAKGSK